MRFQMGFTLIELMLALMIAAVLAGMGYPAYVSHETHAQRMRAEVALMQLAAIFEVYFSDNDSYAGATLKSLNAAALTQGLSYRLKIAKASDTHYILQAIPKNTQARYDSDCGTLSMTDTDKHSISGGGDVLQCWL
ncbi:MAG: prepilin-type N-terminal cleavage/methylation domain-containing protein [Gammaproteobacteria bacterium]|nr:prepilin-type N-terminal cleavage/methylation domain-containing protein [Gammaproteobacteria bacterium]